MNFLSKTILMFGGFVAGLEAGYLSFPYIGGVGACVVTFAMWFLIIGAADYTARKFNVRL